MSIKNRIIFLISGFITGAIFNWSLAYGETDIWGIDHRYYMVIVTVLLAFLLRRTVKTGISSPALMLATGVVLAPALRIFYEIILDATSNNLWPIAMALYVLLIFPAAFLGVFLEQMFRRTRDSESQK